MSTRSMTFVDSGTRWRPALLGLGVGVALLLALFHAEASAALRVWSQSSAFGHCFLVGPIAVWLAWERRHALAAVPPAPWPAAALLALPVAAVWLAAERLGVMEGRQFMALAALWVLALAVLGRRTAWAAAVPLAYLTFLVPFGAFLVPALQAFTARFVDLGLGLLDIPHAVTATLIEIPEGFFRVAEACAGLRFLIASIAFGTLYACVIYRSPRRRVAFLAVSVVAPILANGVRALGIVVLGHVRGSAEAGAVDHVLYGWMFFSMVIVLLLLLGLPFRQDGAAPAPPLSPLGQPVRGRVVAAVVAAVLLAATGPSVAGLLRQRTAGEAVVRRALPVTPPGCTATAEGFSCAGVPVRAQLTEFGAHAGPGEILGALRGTTAEGLAEDTEVSSLVVRGVVWRLVQTHEPDRVGASALWVGGAAAPAGLALRLRLARDSLLGAAVPARLASVVADGRARDAVAAVVAAQGGLESRSAASSTEFIAD